MSFSFKKYKSTLMFIAFQFMPIERLSTAKMWMIYLFSKNLKKVFNDNLIDIDEYE